MGSEFTTSELVGGIAAFVLGFISLICSILTLYIIKLQPTQSNFALLISQLTWSQLIYDSSFLLLPWYRNIVAINILNFLSTYGGTATSMWTNLMSFVIVYVVFRGKTVDIKSSIYFFFIGVNSLAVLFGFFEVFYYFNSSVLFKVDISYYIWRCVSIFINFLCFLAVTYKMWTFESAVGEKAMINPLKTLVNRFKYYPLSQCVCRAGAIWYEWSYGFATNSYDSPSNSTEWAAFLLYAVSTPLAGIFYFIVYLIMQPMANEKFREILGLTDKPNASSGTNTGGIFNFSRFKAVFSDSQTDSMELNRGFLKENNSFVEEASNNSDNFNNKNDNNKKYNDNNNNDANDNRTSNPLSQTYTLDNERFSEFFSLDRTDMPVLPSKSRSSHEDLRLFSDERLEEDINARTATLYFDNKFRSKSTTT